MTRQEIIREYRVNLETGRIMSPGKFEGEMLYVPYFWDMFPDTYAAECGGSLVFRIAPEDRAMFPELGTRRRVVKLIERSDGFVCEV